MTQGSRARDALLLAVLVAVGCWPWMLGLSTWPTTADPPIWIGKSATFTPGWASWVFGGPHFSWYRPVTALSFTMNEVLTGLGPVGFRVTDVALHAICAVLVFRLFRALAPELPGWGAFVAAAVFLAHPIVEEAVPYMARRSYTLATALGYGGLLLIARAASTRARAAGAATCGAALLLAGALCSNEAAVVTIGFAPLAAWLAAGGDVRVATRACVVPLGVVAVAFAGRLAILGEMGGYESGPGEGGVAVLGEMWRGITGLQQDAPPWTAWIAAATVLLPYVLLALRSRPTGVLLAWTAAYALLFVVSGIWFERQLYVVLGPLALLVGAVLARTSREGPTWSLLAPQALMLGAIAWSSPLLRGPDPERVERFRERTHAIDELLEAAESARVPALLITALPNPRDRWRTHPGQGLHRSTRQAVLWARVVLHDRDVELDDVIYFEAGARGDARAVRVDLERKPALVVAPGVGFYAASGGRYVEGAQLRTRRFRLEELSPPADRNVYVYVYDRGEGELTLVREAR